MIDTLLQRNGNGSTTVVESNVDVDDDKSIVNTVLGLRCRACDGTSKNSRGPLCDTTRKWWMRRQETDHDIRCNEHPAKKKRRLVIPPSFDEEESVLTTITTATSADSQPEAIEAATACIPESLLGPLVASFLADRETYNNFKLSSREVYESCRNIPAPWPRKQLECRGVVQAVIFSPSGEILAFAYDDRIGLLDRQTGKRWTLQAPSRVTSLDFSPCDNGRYLASGQRPSNALSDSNIAVCIWDLDCLTAKQNYKACVSDSGDCNIQCCQVLYQYGGSHSVSFSHDGELLASGGIDQTVHLWKKQSTKTGPKYKHTHSLNGMSNWIYNVKFSPNTKYLAAVGESETAVWLWDLDSYSSILLNDDKKSSHRETIHCIDFTANGKYLVSGSDDETIRVWDLQQHPPRCSMVLEGNQCSVWALACSPSKSILHHRSSCNHNPAEESVADESLVVSGGRDRDSGERVLRIWSLESGTTVRMLRGHSDYITSIAFSPSGNTIASGSFDNNLMTHRMAEKLEMSVDVRLA
mmetsp:Transcript_5696/g.10610  ORF Transcript_5696/g.10610 Transcript_5696/m.10610 type:complete len:525 (+) Transcript_5696:40-1614(+)